MSDSEKIEYVPSFVLWAQGEELLYNVTDLSELTLC